MVKRVPGAVVLNQDAVVARVRHHGAEPPYRADGRDLVVRPVPDRHRRDREFRGGYSSVSTTTLTESFDSRKETSSRDLAIENSR